MYSLLAELSAHDLEVAETLIGVIRFLLIFLAARALAEVLVRLSLPTIVGELLAGVVIGASGFHLLIPPSAGTELNEGLVNVISSLASIPPEAVPDVYFESFPSLQAVATLGLYALLFLTGLESELEELVAVGAQAFTVAMAGVILPFAFGTLGLMFIFQVDLIPAVFAGALDDTIKPHGLEDRWGPAKKWFPQRVPTRDRCTAAPLMAVAQAPEGTWQLGFPRPRGNGQ